MANKIISFGNSGENFIQSPSSEVLSSDVELEVFSDVGMQSIANPENSIATSRWKVDKKLNVNAIIGSLRNIFTWIPGERILLPEFGSRLRTLLYEGITPQTEEKIVAEIRHCASKWEPRVQIVEVRDVSTVSDTEDNTIHLEVVFTIPGLSEEQYTYSFSYSRKE